MNLSDTIEEIKKRFVKETTKLWIIEEIKKEIEKAVQESMEEIAESNNSKRFVYLRDVIEIIKRKFGPKLI